MPSARSTQPRLVTEPTTKPTLAAPRHSRMPTCTRWIGCCAFAPAKDATSMVAAIPARVNERRMKKSPADQCDASSATVIQALLFYATTSAAVPDLPRLFQSDVIPGRAKREPGISRFRVWSFGPSRNDKVNAARPRKKRPAPRASFALALWLLSRDDGGDA